MVFQNSLRFYVIGSFWVVLYFLGTLTSFAWRSELYPESWTPPENSSFYTDKLIQDFSYAGYKRGEEPLPEVTGPIVNAVLTHGADPTGTNDSTAAIQAAINAVGAEGGVVYLPAGTYLVKPSGSNGHSLRVRKPNVVLRGAGVGKTFLLNTSYEMRSKSVILFQPTTMSYGDSIAITADLDSPTQRIPVADASRFSVGDFIRLRWDFTPEWVNEHGQNSYWGNGNTAPPPAEYLREVMAVNTAENWIYVDVPTRYTMLTRDNARVESVNGQLSNVGVESLSIGNVQNPGSGWGFEDYKYSNRSAYQAHGSWLLRLQNCRDSWVTNVESFQAAGNSSSCHMLSNGIQVRLCFRITVANCVMQRSQYGGGGGNGYMFRIHNTQDSLIKDCTAEFSRHGIVISSEGTSGNVFLRCQDRETGRSTGSTGSYETRGSGSDNHMRFSHSNLWDSCHAHNSYYSASHRGHSGTIKHALTSAHGVYWNTSGSGTTNDTIVYSTQGRYGYVIGTSGTKNGTSGGVGGNTEPRDHFEGISIGDRLEPQSLYADQLAKRMKGILVDAGDDAKATATNSYQLKPNVHSYGHDPVNHTWTQIHGPTAALIDDTTSLATSVVLPIRGDYHFSLISENGANRASDGVTLTALDSSNIAPRIAVDSVIGRTENTTSVPVGYQVSTSNASVGVKSTNGDRNDLNIIYRYQLPDLPDGEIISGFTMNFRITSFRDHSNDDYELDVYLLDVVDASTTGTDLFYHGENDADHVLIGSHHEASGSNTSSVNLDPPTDVIFHVDSGPALTLLRSFYVRGQKEIAIRFNLDQLRSSLSGHGLNRYVLNNSAASALEIRFKPRPFDDWIAGYKVGQQTGSNDDSDFDGVPNIVEAWFGTDPDKLSASLVNRHANGEVATFTHPKNIRPPSDLNASYEWSSNLVDWYKSNEEPLAGPVVNIRDSSIGDVTTVTTTASEPMTNIFLRLKVDKQE